MKQKKLVALLLSTVIMMVVLAGCGGNQQQQQQQQTPQDTKGDQKDQTTPDDGKSNAQDSSSGDTYYLGIAIHSLDNEFWAQEAEGAMQFASSVPNLETRVLTCDSDDNKQLQGIKDFIAEYGDKAIIVVDPSSAANTANIAEVCEAAGVYVTILTHRAEGLFPEDYEYFTVHMTPNDIDAGYRTAKYLFDSIGGQGKVCELYGQLGNDAAAARSAGLQLALQEYPNIELVETVVASWSPEEALKATETWLAMHDDIAAIFCANDTMALGAIEALKQEGLNGQIKVCGTDGITAAFEAVESGDLLCTIANDGYMLMGYGAAYAYYAAAGAYVPSELSLDERMFYSKTAFVDASNVAEMKAKLITGTPGYDYSDLEFASAGPQDRSKLN